MKKENKYSGSNFSCQHPKLCKWLKSNFISFLIGGSISLVLTVSATVILHSGQVRYKDNKSVETAINELYEKADEIKYAEMNKMGCDQCTKLEYLESTGTQYIDTGIIGKSGQSSLAKFMYNEVSNNTSIDYDHALLGCRNVNTRFYFYLNSYDGVSKFLIGYSNYYFSNIKTEKETLYEAETILNVNQQKLIVNNNVYEVNNGDIINTNLNMYVFALNHNNNPISFSKVNLYYLKVYDSSILVRDYIPVLDKNNRPCLFDKVSKTCFYNQGTGEFLYG